MNELSIIIPCTSSLGKLPSFIDELAFCVMDNPTDIDIIVVLNEQVDFVADVVRHVRSKYPWLKFEMLKRSGKSRSYGALARFGIAYSTSRYAVLVSPYGDDDIGIIDAMLANARNGAQVVQATRYASGSDAENVRWRFRLYQVIYRFLTRLFIGFKLSDSTYGFKMFDRVFIQALGLNQNGYSICPEITFKTLLAGGNVEYISSSVKSISIGKDFKLYKEGLGYLWLLMRGCVHRLGVLWF